jgi:ribosome maturation factor RimP
LRLERDAVTTPPPPTPDELARARAVADAERLLDLLDDVAEASRAVSQALDDSEVMGQAPYVLEVSTPGVDRPLVEQRHFARNTGRLVRVRLADGSTVDGRVQSADDRLVLTIPGPKKGMTATRELEWAEVARGAVQVEFSHKDEES